MKPIQNISDPSQSIGAYPDGTGRHKRVIGAGEITRKVGLLGDSTLDNGVWVQKNKRYKDKTHTVTHQTAVALAKSTHNTHSYEIATFAVDGATTTDLMRECYLNKVLPADEDHPMDVVHQLNEAAAWKPDIAVLSVGGNNYREALMGVLRKNVSTFRLLFRTTPESAKPLLKNAFVQVKQKLLEEYKAIIDDLILQNPGLSRMVLLSQYFPSLTDFTPYFIYAGFSHIARAEGRGQTAFEAVEETMNELYRSVLEYAATKNKEVVFVDVTSSLSPLGGNHTLQIEPNHRGSAIMGQLIAQAVEYDFPPHYIQATKPIPVIRMDKNQNMVSEVLEGPAAIKNFQVKKINSFIRENRYSHIGLFFAPSTSLKARYVHGYEVIMGKQFDKGYTGLFAFGLIDLSLVTIMASYLWRVAQHEKIPLAIKVPAGIVAAPILLTKMILGLTLMAALALPILGYHFAVNGLGSKDKKEEAISEGQLGLAMA